MARVRRRWYRVAEIALLVAAAVSGAVILVNLVSPQRTIVALFVAGVVFTASLLMFIALLLEPDRVRATTSDAMLMLASETLEALGEEGFSGPGPQQICELLLPETSAVAVAITDKESILGFAGRDADLNPIGSPIHTSATHAVIRDGKLRILHTQDEIGLIHPSTIHAAIIVPLTIGSETVGTLKFYYPSARRINETQESVALGFAELLSTQAAAKALEEQRKLATSMELKALQSQINPHFLFNTINTIASFIRTDPDHARDLLREFAVFYRSTLENAEDLITLERELDQTQRYLGFEIARFGDDRLRFTTDIDDVAKNCLVPAFMVQPIVENAVRHAMPSEGVLHVACTAHVSGEDLSVMVSDDGVGMSAEERDRMFDGGSSEGLGIAMRNIRERVEGYFGSESSMQVESTEGKGTQVTLFLKGATANRVS